MMWKYKCVDKTRVIMHTIILSILAIFLIIAKFYPTLDNIALLILYLILVVEFYSGKHVIKLVKPIAKVRATINQRMKNVIRQELRYRLMIAFAVLVFIQLFILCFLLRTLADSAYCCIVTLSWMFFILVGVMKPEGREKWHHMPRDILALFILLSSIALFYLIIDVMSGGGLFIAKYILSGILAFILWNCFYELGKIESELQGD